MQLDEILAGLSVDIETVRRRIHIASQQHTEHLRELGDELTGLRSRVEQLRSGPLVKK